MCGLLWQYFVQVGEVVVGIGFIDQCYFYVGMCVFVDFDFVVVVVYVGFYVIWMYGVDFDWGIVQFVCQVQGLVVYCGFGCVVGWDFEVVDV